MGDYPAFTSNLRLDNAQLGDNTFVVVGVITALDPRPVRANAPAPRVYLFRCILSNMQGRHIRILFWEEMARLWEPQVYCQVITISRARVVLADSRFPGPAHLMNIEISIQRNTVITLHGLYENPANAALAIAPEIPLAEIGQAEGLVRIVGFIETSLEDQVFGNASYGSGAMTDGYYRLTINVTAFNRASAPPVGSHVRVQGTLRRNNLGTLLLQISDMSSISVVDDHVMGAAEMAEGFRIPPGVANVIVVQRAQAPVPPVMPAVPLANPILMNPAAPVPAAVGVALPAVPVAGPVRPAVPLADPIVTNPGAVGVVPPAVPVAGPIRPAVPLANPIVMNPAAPVPAAVGVAPPAVPVAGPIRPAGPLANPILMNPAAPAAVGVAPPAVPVAGPVRLAVPLANPNVMNVAASVAGAPAAVGVDLPPVPEAPSLRTHDGTPALARVQQILGLSLPSAADIQELPAAAGNNVSMASSSDPVTAPIHVNGNRDNGTGNYDLPEMEVPLGVRRSHRRHRVSSDEEEFCVFDASGTDAIEPDDVAAASPSSKAKDSNSLRGERKRRRQVEQFEKEAVRQRKAEALKRRGNQGNVIVIRNSDESSDESD